MVRWAAAAREEEAEATDPGVEGGLAAGEVAVVAMGVAEVVGTQVVEHAVEGVVQVALQLAPVGGSLEAVASVAAGLGTGTVVVVVTVEEAAVEEAMAAAEEAAATSVARREVVEDIAARSSAIPVLEAATPGQEILALVAVAMVSAGRVAAAMEEAVRALGHWAAVVMAVYLAVVAALQG